MRVPGRVFAGRQQCHAHGRRELAGKNTEIVISAFPAAVGILRLPQRLNGLVNLRGYRGIDHLEILSCKISGAMRFATVALASP